MPDFEQWRITLDSVA